MNIVSLTVSAAIMGTLMPGVMLVSIAPTVASIRAKNFAQAETAAITFATLAQDKYTVPTESLPEFCDVTLIEERTYNVTCTYGESNYTAEATRAFSLLDNIASSLTVTTDNDRDGFDDTTGLPTHYWQCYSGWSGQKPVKNNCELGGPFVIPAYRHIYN